MLLVFSSIRFLQERTWVITSIGRTALAPLTGKSIGAPSSFYTASYCNSLPTLSDRSRRERGGAQSGSIDFGILSFPNNNS